MSEMYVWYWNADPDPDPHLEQDFDFEKNFAERHQIWWASLKHKA